MRLRSLLAALLVVCGLAACGSGEEDGGGAARDVPPPSTETAQPGEAAPGFGDEEAESEPAPAATRERRRRPIRSSQKRGRVEVIARGLEVPWDIAFLPDGRALVTEREGRVRLVGRNGRLRREPVARVPVSARGEGGLLGIAVDPDFAGGRRNVYLYVTRGEILVERWRWTGSELRRRETILSGIRAGSIHDSGRLRFGPDDRLYVTTGDAGQGSLAQDSSSRNGKVLRLGPRAYREGEAGPRRYALGLRNPQGLDWQPGSDRLWATDHGPSGFDGPSGDDEVNIIRRGRNYGWPRVRGRNHGSFAAPAWVWSSTVAPSGLAFVSRGGSAWTGDALVAALRGRSLRRLDIRGTRVVSEQVLLSGTYGRLRAVVEAPDGSFWITTSNRDGYGSPVSGDDDRILRLIPPRR